MIINLFSLSKYNKKTNIIYYYCAGTVMKELIYY